MTATLFILNEAPYGSERAYNGLRLAGALAARDGPMPSGAPRRDSGCPRGTTTSR